MARLVELNEVLRHLKIPSSQIKRTGVELGNGSYGKVYEVDYSGKLCAAKEFTTPVSKYRRCSEIKR